MFLRKLLLLIAGIVWLPVFACLCVHEYGKHNPEVARFEAEALGRVINFFAPTKRSAEDIADDVKVAAELLSQQLEENEGVVAEVQPEFYEHWFEDPAIAQQKTLEPLPVATVEPRSDLPWTAVSDVPFEKAMAWYTNITSDRPVQPAAPKAQEPAASVPALQTASVTPQKPVTLPAITVEKPAPKKVEAKKPARLHIPKNAAEWNVLTGIQRVVVSKLYVRENHLTCDFPHVDDEAGILAKTSWDDVLKGMDMFCHR